MATQLAASTSPNATTVIYFNQPDIAECRQNYTTLQNSNQKGDAMPARGRPQGKSRNVEDTCSRESLRNRTKHSLSREPEHRDQALKVKNGALT